MKKNKPVKIAVVLVAVCLMFVGAIPRAYVYADSEFLSNTSVTNATLSPAFHPNNYDYQMVLDTGYTSSEISVAPDDQGATVTINGVEQTSITLSEDDIHQAIILVVSADGQKSRTYTIDLVPRSNNADLSDIDVATGILSPSFSPDKTDYTVTPFQGSFSTKVLVSLADSFASVTINGQNKSTIKLDLNDPEYATTAEIQVTAADGVTKKVYRHIDKQQRAVTQY